MLFNTNVGFPDISPSSMEGIMKEKKKLKIGKNLKILQNLK